MPRVTQEHLDARRRQILDAARRCFAREGFHATSMHDVLREAGLSAGAVYRYFPGKEEIIGAIAQDVLAAIAAAVEEAFDEEGTPSFDEAIGRMLGAVERLERGDELAMVAIQAWGEALRSERTAGQVREAIGALRSLMQRVAEGARERGELAPDVPPERAARLLSALLPGFLVQRALMGDVDAESFASALRGLSRRSIDPVR